MNDFCTCGHEYGDHFRDDMKCESCECEGFTERRRTQLDWDQEEDES